MTADVFGLVTHLEGDVEIDGHRIALVTLLEAIALGLREGVGALHLERVLGRDDHERRRERIGGAVNRDLALLH